MGTSFSTQLPLYKFGSNGETKGRRIRQFKNGTWSIESKRRELGVTFPPNKREWVKVSLGIRVATKKRRVARKTARRGKAVPAPGKDPQAF